MHVNLDKTFPIEVPLNSAWKFLQDIPGVASCMPGAEITEVVDDRHYKGAVKAKLGPATMAFNGDIEVKGMDAAKHELQLLGRGQDTKGSSSAEMDLTAQLVETGSNACELKGSAVVTVNGKAASLGGRMMTQVADQILNQFGKNFTAHVLATQEGDAAAASEAQERLAEQPKELNGLAFAWSVIVGFFRSLFGAKSSSN
ncbi:SRPBCC family protein [Candidatus Thiothrix sp. Deng01]|uniref:SRPBCC family protein n=1 Tax=Candidatus Thiothrix phosphatis TaxID=3112415 RepID=A0ABU6D373_9GAMM|nr:SRPBCC family protein [Candidatus Thiothrix sp. Deng01]MEB4593241.1 SRPBCC family protein [Candidatus Thiothrix sp. Deng01]